MVRSKRKNIFTILLVLVTVTLTACAWFDPDEEKSAQELASDGMDYFERKKYKKALQSFEQLKDFYPFSKFAILAELKMGDCHYHLEQYQEAIFTYEEFVELHPRNEAVPYVIYQIGMSYFDQMDTIDRDQSTTYKAIDTFKQLIDQYPQSTYVEKAKENIRIGEDNLAGHQFYVGKFYFKSDHYPAAIERFNIILEQYPNSPLAPEAEKYLRRAKEALAKIEGDD
jgi:outer membrane protein assembly factor BamD